MRMVSSLVSSPHGIFASGTQVSLHSGLLGRS